MRRILYYLQLNLIFTTLWVVLKESFSISTILTGLFLSLITLWFSEKFLLGESYYQRYPFNLFKMLVYGFFLIIEIYKAGIGVTLKVISGDINPDIVDITTDINEPYHKSLLANSITLTPGTVTLDTRGSLLKVLWLDTKTKQPIIAGQQIKGSLERRL